MEKPQIKVNSDGITKIWGYSFKECIDYIQYTYKISDIVYGDLISWADPIVMEYPFYFIEKVTDQIKNPYQFIADEVLQNLYSSVNIQHRNQLIDSIEMLFIQFSISHTIENVPVLAFLDF
jgi:hypothetical protein